VASKVKDGERGERSQWRYTETRPPSVPCSARIWLERRECRSGIEKEELEEEEEGDMRR
jgi:hypothetical protein